MGVRGTSPVSTRCSPISTCAGTSASSRASAAQPGITAMQLIALILPACASDTIAALMAGE